MRSVSGGRPVRRAEYPPRMSFDLALPCQGCGVSEPVNVVLMASWWEWRCARCGHENAVLSSTEWTLGWRVLEKAKSEYLAAGDYSTSIIFAAMAVEAELARMYFKWRKIDHVMIAGLRPLEGGSPTRSSMGNTET